MAGKALIDAVPQRPTEQAAECISSHRRGWFRLGLWLLGRVLGVMGRELAGKGVSGAENRMSGGGGIWLEAKKSFLG
jgi:hypothetical protein